MHKQKILVALDDSPRAPTVFDVGAAYARALGEQLYLLRAVTMPPEFPAAAAYSTRDQLPGYLDEIAKHELNELAKRAPDVQVTRTIVTFGAPSQVILETAENLEVDLIVIGSHGFRGWDHVLGTTAANIANRAKRNVLVVHTGV